MKLNSGDYLFPPSAHWCAILNLRKEKQNYLLPDIDLKKLRTIAMIWRDMNTSFFRFMSKGVFDYLFLRFEGCVGINGNRVFDWFCLMKLYYLLAFTRSSVLFFEKTTVFLEDIVFSLLSIFTIHFSESFYHHRESKSSTLSQLWKKNELFRFNRFSNHFIKIIIKLILCW